MILLPWEYNENGTYARNDVNMSSPKYNRTPHLPWSPGKGADDKVSKSVESLLERSIVISEKVDGSNTSLEADGCLARTHAHTPTHASFDFVKTLHASIKHMIPRGVQCFGENMYARHSIAYTELPGYFLLFGIRFVDDNCWADWDYIVARAKDLNIPTVPVLWSGQVASEKELKTITMELAAQKSACGGEREGVVVRTLGGFKDEDFSKSVMKYVRKNHVQTDEHWKDQEIVKNGLK